MKLDKSKIEEIMGEMRLTQGELGQMMLPARSQQAVHNLLRDLPRRNVRQATARSLALALDVPVGLIMAGEAEG